MIQDYAKAWNWVKGELQNITDPILRNTILADMKQRALTEWGFCPEDGSLASDDDLILDKWESKFVEDIQDTENYGVDLRKENRANAEKEMRNAMRKMILDGKGLHNVPDDIRTPWVDKIFLEELMRYGDELCSAADYLLNTVDNEKKQV